MTGFGDDDWLMDRKIRRDWLRSIAVMELARRILRTPASAHDGVTCLFEELFGKTPPMSSAMVARYVRDDTRQFASWLATATRARRARGIGVVVSDGAPYMLQLTRFTARATDPTWADSISWRSAKWRRLTLIDHTLRRTDKRDADYVLPVAYPALLLRDAGFSGVVTYCGGDQLVVQK